MAKVCVFILLILAPLLALGEDLYRTLGVSRSATSSQIKTAYRKLAKEWHPDKNKSPDAKDKFISISTAYEVLSVEEKRQHYDQTGSIGDASTHRSHSAQHSFTIFQSGQGFQFHFPGNSQGRGPERNRDSISSREFFEGVVPGSDHKPYLLYFYHDFCFECVRVDSIWEELRKDLPPLGVGVATVHTSAQPRVAQFCSVSRMPSIVAVVSGRAVHFNEWIQDSRSIKNFIKSVLPASVVVKLTEANMEAFLADAISRNRPRILLFSRGPSPSLTYHLVALHLHATLDFAYASTGRGVLEGAVGRRFGVGVGERRILVYKEDHVPVLVEEVDELSRDILLGLVEKMTLYLPRLSSPAVFHNACPVDDSSKLCAVLVVEGDSQYNDSMATAFRRIAAAGSQGSVVLYSYIDGTIQAGFLGNFEQGASQGVVMCADEKTPARRVLLLKRSSKLVQYKWIDGFCGELEHDLSMQFQSGGVKSCTLKQELLDEEAPGWFGRQWNKVMDYYYNFMSAINLNSETLTFFVSLLFTSLLLCVMAALSGVQSEEKEAREPKSNQRGTPADKGHAFHIYPLDSQSYESCVLSPVRGLITLVLLVDNTTKQGEELVNAYGKILSRHRYGNLRLFFACYHKHWRWFFDLLSQCPQLSRNEVASRVRGCVNGGVATAVLLFGAKKQLALFPESFDVVLKLCRGLEEGTDRRGANEKEGREETGVEGMGEEGGERRPEKKGGERRPEKRGGERRPEKRDGKDENVAVRKETNRPMDVKNKREVGGILGSVFGYESSDEESGDSSDPNQQYDEDDDGVQHRPQSANSAHHDPRPPSAGVGRRTAGLEQVSTSFENWCERMGDGSLRRCGVEVWPEWTRS